MQTGEVDTLVEMSATMGISPLRVAKSCAIETTERTADGTGLRFMWLSHVESIKRYAKICIEHNRRQIDSLQKEIEACERILDLHDMGYEELMRYKEAQRCSMSCASGR